MPDTSSEPRFRNSRARRRHEDRKLVRVAAAKQLGVSVTALAAQLRSAGITERLEPGQVNQRVPHPEQAPQWFAPALQAAREADAARLREQQPPHRRRRRASQAVTPSAGQDAERLEQFLAELRQVHDGAARPRRRRRRG